MSMQVLANVTSTRLAACLAAALGSTLCAARIPDTSRAGISADSKAISWPTHHSGSSLKPHKPHLSSYTPAAPAAVSTVTNCADDGSPGTLRYEVINAPTGATIDLSTLACSTITLSDSWPVPELQVMQDSLYLKGPGDRHLTIDGAEHSSVLRHFGGGTLGITDLTIANGYHVSNPPNGGCIYSASDVVLTRSVISDCTVGSNSAPPRGGAVLTKGSLTLSSSTIKDSSAISIGPMGADGGGAFVFGDFRAYYSTVTNNTAYAKYANSTSLAGGIDALANVTLEGSTISANRADEIGGIDMDAGMGYAAKITNSTVSGNVANLRFGGIWTNVAFELSNSTVAFNRANASGSFPGAGLYFKWPVTLQSSIIAGNVSDAGPSDLGASANYAVTAISSNNLITSSSVTPPAGTIQDCPKLQPLADNGGLTLTHALSQASPALDSGNNSEGLVTDQRFATRVVNAAADIGSIEWQLGEQDERVFVSGFEGFCDQ